MRLIFPYSYVVPKRIKLSILYNIFFILIAGVLTTHAQAPTITGFSPTTICPGGTITITGTNFTGATSVLLGSLEATNVTVVSATTITANVADLSATGTVSVTTAAGTVTANGNLTISSAPEPRLTDMVSVDGPFSNCDGNASYVLTVSNNSNVTGTGNMYEIDWGDHTPHFSQTDWGIGNQLSHTYAAQGYFPIVITITAANGCSRTETYRFYNGKNPLASFTTSASTTGLCVPAPVEFQIGNWIDNTPGTTYVIDFGDGSPNLTLQHPLNATNTTHLLTHTYNTSSCPGANDFTATLRVINGCFTTTYTLNQIIIRQKPEANFRTNPNAPCENESVCFINETVSGYSGNACNTNSIYTWDFGDGTIVNGVTSPCHTYAAAGTYNVTLTAANSTCGGDAITKQVVVSPISPLPVPVPAVYCQGETAVPLSATGTGLLWYTSAAGGTGSPTAPTPSTNLAGTRTYYVSQTLPNHCESPRVPVTVTVNPLPSAPGVTTPVQLCLNQPVTPLTATGIGLLWYTTATGGTGSSTAPTPSTAAVGNTSYYVSQTVNGCEGPRAAILVTVSPLPVAPVTAPVVYCQDESAVPLTAAGTGLLWYTATTGGVGSPTAPTPSTATPGSTTYYVSQATGCGESPRASITVNVTERPSAAISYTPAVFCNVVNSLATPNLPVTVTFSGTTGGSYSISPATGLSIDAVTGTLDPSGATAGTYTIRYAVAGAGGCPDYNTTATVTVNGTPTASIAYPAICTSDGPISVSLTGASGGLFTSTTGLTINSSTGIITPSTSTPGTYTVTYQIAASAPCPGYTTTTNVTVTQAPSAAISYAPSMLCNVINSPTTPNLPVAVTFSGTTGGSYSISPATGLPIDAATGELDPSGAAAGTYTISYRIPGVGGCGDYITTAMVTVNSTPVASIAYGAICTSDGPISVSLTGTSGGVFTSAAGLTINASTGVITPSTSTPGTYTVTYEIAASAPCPGYTTTTNVTVTQAPSAAISYAPSMLCNVINSPTTPNLPVAVTFSGTTGGSYSISPATGLSIDATGVLDPSGAVAGTYTISYRIPGAGGCGDYAATTTVTISDAPTAAINYSGPYCGGITAPQPVTFSGTPGGVFSAAPGLSVNATTGAINPALSIPGVYTVTYTIAPSAPCPGYITTAAVEIVESPVISFTLASQYICSGESAVFEPSSTVSGTTYTWAVVGPLPANVAGISSGTASGNNPAISLSFTNTGTILQSLTIRVIPVNPSPVACPGASHDLTLIVRPVVPAPVTDTVNFCMDMPAAALHVNPLPGNTIRWHDGNMVVLNAVPVINPAVPGLFKYYVTQFTGDGCESLPSEIVAVVHPTAKIISATRIHPTACGVPSGSIILDLLDLNNNAMPNTPVVVHYNRFQIPSQFSGNTDASGRIAIPLTAGTYSEIYVETSGSCMSQKIPDVFVLRDPTPPEQPVAGYNPPLCSGTELRLTALSATGTQDGPIDYVWAGPAFGPLADTARNTVVTFPSVSVSDAGTYVVYAMQNNCISLPASFEVMILQSPATPVIITRTPLCVGEDLVLQASSSIPGNATLNYVWNGPGSGFPVNSPNAGISNIRIQDAGIYTVTVTSTQTGCVASSDTFIQVGGYPVVQFAQDTVALPTGYRLNLVPVITNATDPGILPMQNYTWTPSTDLSCNDAICSSAIATIKNNICYKVTATNIYGCSGSDDICINVFCESSQVFVPNAFAPTGNVPENRKLMVRATGINAVKSFRVFNRWGRIVFERSNFPPNSPDFGWDGMVNGKPADTGVYVYTVEVICENGVPYTFKGNVTLF